MDLLRDRPSSVFLPDELERAKGDLLEHLPTNPVITGKPKAILLGGQPASGKNRLTQHINRIESVNFVVINGDEYRSLHPRFEEIQVDYGQDAPKITQPFSNALVEFMKAECLQRKLSFIIEGTMRTYNVIESTAREARSHGFKVEAHVMAIHSADSYLGIFQRYEGEMSRYMYGRFSPLLTHDEAYQNIPANLQKASEQHLFDQITVYCRDETDSVKLAHSSEMGENVDFVTLFNRIRQPQLSPEQYSPKWKTLHQQALKRGEINPNYLRYITDFCTQYP